MLDDKVLLLTEKDFFYENIFLGAEYGK